MKGYTFGCTLSGIITILAAIALLVAACICVQTTSDLKDVWTEIWSLSIYSLIFSILAILFSIGLIYVVYRKLPALTSLFSVLIVIVFILNAISIVILAVSLAGLRDDCYKQTTSLFNNYSESKNISSRLFFGDIQQDFECCGINEAMDWKTKLISTNSTPDSCCRKVAPGCGTNALNRPKDIYLRGCAVPIYYYLRGKYVVLLVLNCVLLIFLAVSAVCGFMSERYIRQQYESM